MFSILNFDTRQNLQLHKIHHREFRRPQRGQCKLTILTQGIIRTALCIPPAQKLSFIISTMSEARRSFYRPISKKLSPQTHRDVSRLKFCSNEGTAAVPLPGCNFSAVRYGGALFHADDGPWPLNSIQPSYKALLWGYGDNLLWGVQIHHIINFIIIYILCIARC